MDNNKGYSFIELVLSMAVTAVVVTIVISFLITNSKEYSYANNEVKLQMEAQTVMNQLYEDILEADWIELIDVSSDVKALIIYHLSDSDAVFLNIAEKRLYLVEGLKKSETADPGSILYTPQENLMASDVTDMEIYPADMDSLSENKITLMLKLDNSTAACSLQQDIKFRNKLVKP